MTIVKGGLKKLIKREILTDIFYFHTHRIILVHVDVQLIS